MTEPAEVEYAIIPNAVIHPRFGKAVGEVLAMAGRDLRLKRLSIRFWVESEKAPPSWERIRVLEDDQEHQERWGGPVPAWVSPERPDLIYLHPMWSASIAQILLHEARHVWQQNRHPAPWTEEEYEAARAANEADAIAYAARSMTRLQVREIGADVPRLRRGRH